MKLTFRANELRCRTYKALAERAGLDLSEWLREAADHHVARCAGVESIKTERAMNRAQRIAVSKPIAAKVAKMCMEGCATMDVLRVALTIREPHPSFYLSRLISAAVRAARAHQQSEQYPDNPAHAGDAQAAIQEFERHARSVREGYKGRMEYMAAQRAAGAPSVTEPAAPAQEPAGEDSEDGEDFDLAELFRNMNEKAAAERA